MDPLIIAVMACVALSVAIVVERVLSLLFGRRAVQQKEIRRRATVHGTRDERIRLRKAEDEYANSIFGKTIGHVGFVKSTAVALACIKPGTSVSTFYSLSILGCLLAVIVAQIQGYGFLLSTVIGAVVAALPTVWLKWKFSRYLLEFEHGLVEAIDIMIRALRSGHPFNEALLLVTEELEGATAHEFGLLFAELNYGASAREAFEGMLDRIPSVALRGLMVGILLQKQAGGNLAEVLQNINNLLRARFKFQRRIRTLSAEGRLSGIILGSIPFVLFVVIRFINPSYMAQLTHTATGHRILAVGVVMLILGILWMRKIIRIEV